MKNSLIKKEKGEEEKLKPKAISLSMSSSREKRRKRKRKREPSPESKPTPRSSSSIPPTPESSSPIPSLPYDLVLLCVARVSRLYYPTLSLVSKSFRSLVSAPELYKTRSLFGFTESCLYVCLKNHGCTADWYTLCCKPDKTLKTKTGSSTSGYTSGYALAKVPVPNSPPSHCRNVVAVGSSIYNIAFPRSLNDLPRVSVLDCKSHTGWIDAPSLPVELHSFSSSVIDHKIYVTGVDYCLKNSFQVFDTETRVWDSVSTGDEREEMFMEQTVSIDGKFHVVTDEEVLAYDPKQGNWDMVGDRMGWRLSLSSDAYCVIGNVLYSASEGVFEWYDTERRMWRDLPGLVGLPVITRHRGFIRLGDYGGKMVVFWGSCSWPYDYKEIWCAEIALERRGGDTSEIWGKVEWFDELLEIDINYHVEKVLSTTL